MDRIDLHGVPHAKVANMVEDYILLHDPPMEIITGNSNEMQKIVIAVLKKHLMGYVIHAYNLGVIVVL